MGIHQMDLSNGMCDESRWDRKLPCTNQKIGSVSIVNVCVHEQRSKLIARVFSHIHFSHREVATDEWENILNKPVNWQY